jgi:hypothetical protein
MSSNNRKHYFVLFIFIILIIAVSQSWKVFNLPPASVHQWRQSDCAAYVKTYYSKGSGLLSPATYNLGGKEGRVISEFPIVYYISAQIQHLVGPHYWVVRLLTFLCYVSGLVALLACVRKWIPNPILAFLPVILLASSPYYYYYAINFLPNVPAIAFSFIGLYFFLLYEQKKKLLGLIAGTLFFILSTALKPTDGGLLWLAYVAVKVVQAIFSPGTGTARKQNIIPLVVSSLLIAASIIGWTKYVNWYNDLNGNHQNLIGIYPIWDMDKDLIKYTAKRVLTEWSNVFQQRIILGVLALFGLAYMLKWKQLNHFLRLMTLFLFLGAGAYAILWFKAFTDHDYYQLPFVLPATFLGITVLEYVNRALLPGFSAPVRNASYAVCILLAGIGIYHNRSIQKERYTRPEYVYLNPAIYEVEPYLRKIGVKSSDAVVCVPDRSPNITLNAINNYGYTEEFNSDEYNIHTFKARGAAYLIISDSSYLQHELYLPYLHKKIGEYKGIYIFDIR